MRTPVNTAQRVEDEDLLLEDRPEPTGMTRPVPMGWFLIAGSLLGLWASYALSIDKFRLLADPEASLSCDFNPFFSCGSVMSNWQSELLGFPNQFLGIAAFIFPLLIGVMLVSGAQIPRWIMVGLNIGLLAGVSLVMFLFYSSIFVIGVGCPWCMLVWLVTIPMFVLVTAHNALSGNFGSAIAYNNGVRIAAGMPIPIAILWLLGIAMAVVVQFWQFFSTLF